MTEEIVPHESREGQILQGPDWDFLGDAMKKLVREVMESVVHEAGHGPGIQ